MINIYQGDALSLPISINKNGTDVTDEDIDKLEVILCGINKTYPGDVTYEDGLFMFPVTQDETLGLKEGTYDISIRPLFKDSTVRGWLSAGSVRIIKIGGAEVL